MHFGLVVVLAVLPGMLAIWFADRLDRQRPEPPASLRRLVIAGALSVVPCIFIENALRRVGPTEGYAWALYRSFVVAAGVEELGKVACLRLFAWNRPEFDERTDGIVYAVRAALGFALVENLQYLMSRGAGRLVTVALLRACLSIPAHAICGGLMGYFAARRRFDGRGIGMVGGYLIAVLVHGLFDAASFVGDVAHIGSERWIIPVATTIVGAVVLRRLAKSAADADAADQRLSSAVRDAAV